MRARAARTSERVAVELDARVHHLDVGVDRRTRHAAQATVVAETEVDMRALLAGAGAMSTEPLSLLLPTRQANLFRWCLHQGMRAIKPMTLMTMGHYQEPEGCYFPSVLY